MKNRIAAWLMTAVLAVTTVGADASIVFADNPDVAAESVVEKTEEGSLDSGEVTDSADNENLTDVVNENAESISDSVSQPDSMTATEEGEEVNTPHSEEEKLPESVPASADSDTVQSSSEATGGEGIVEEGSEPTAAPAVEEVEKQESPL